MIDDELILKNFCGKVRLFPLPNLVLFPFVVQGLHIFEHRYRQMTADILADDGLITLTLLQPGWEANYQGSPPIFPVGCLARILSHEKLKNGKYNLQVRGLSRLRIIEEHATDKPYRIARAKLLEDANVPSVHVGIDLRLALLRAITNWCPSETPGDTVFHKLLKSNLPMGMVVDIISFALPIRLESKQELLEIEDVQKRVSRLVHHLEEQPPPTVAAAAAKIKFPPEFSTN
jgi:Lon protease-like protein